MSKRTRRGQYRSRPLLKLKQQVARALGCATEQMEVSDFAAAAQTCELLLPLVPQHSYDRAELLNCLGTAFIMLKNYDSAYAAFSEALTIVPDDPYLWYNRGYASRYTMRTGRALQDFERAVALEGHGEMSRQYAQAAQSTRSLVLHNLSLRGSHFTLEQLIEQEELFQQAVALMNAEQWDEAAVRLRQVIAIGDGLPQPWTNLGICLMVQQQYDAAEMAYQHAISLDPDYENAHYHLSVLSELRQAP